MASIIVMYEGPSGMKADLTKKYIKETTQKLGSISITPVLEGGEYALLFDDGLGAAFFGIWLLDRSVKHQLHQVPAGISPVTELLRLLPGLAALAVAHGGYPTDAEAQRMREATIADLVKSITDPANRL